MSAPPIVFGVLSQSVATQSKTFTATLVIQNAVSATITTVAANLGSNWTIRNTNPAQSLWTISGTAPSALIGFSLSVTAVNSDATSTVTELFPIVVTSAGIVSDDQSFMSGLSNLALWIDPSEASTLVTQFSGTIGYLFDRANGYGWSLTSSETIARDAGVFGSPGITFSNIVYANAFNTSVMLDQTSAPNLTQAADFSGVPVADASGYSTLFMVVGYSASSIPVPDACFYAFDTPVFDGTDATLKGAWGVDTKSVGVTPLSVLMSQSEKTLTPKKASKYLAENVVPVGGSAVICWRYGPNGCDIRINSLPTPLDYSTDNGATKLLQVPTPVSGFIAPKTIGVFGSPAGYSIGSFGEIIALKGYASDAQVAVIESRLKAKWLGGQASVPTITTNSTLVEYVGQQYTGYYTITNGSGHLTTASVVATAGSNWTIAQVSPTDYTNWQVTGTMPATAGAVTLSVSAQTDKVSNVVEFVIAGVTAPPAPVINTLAPFQAVVGDVLTAYVDITNADQNISTAVSITATAGTGWTITESVSQPTRFTVSGTLPTTPGSFQVTITASNSNGGQTATTTKNFTISAVAAAVVKQGPYNLDLTGKAQANLISAEAHTLTPTNGVTRQILIPRLGPFFGQGLILTYKGFNNTTLVAIPGIDYQPVVELFDVSSALGLDVYAAIEVLNLAIDGHVSISYQTIGGKFVLDRNAAYAKLAEVLANQRTADWSMVTNLPTYFHPSAHYNSVETDVVGLSTLNASLTSLSVATAAFANEVDVAAMTAHIAQTGNVHNVTPAQIGLGLVNNYPPSTPAQAIDPVNNNTYLTPATATLAGQAGLATATSTVYGVTTLNLGNAAGDDLNPVEALTPAGFASLFSSTTPNALTTAFANGQKIAQVSPTPLVFPLYWNNKQYLNLADFITAVQTYVDVYPLQYDSSINAFYFPLEITPPSLVTYQSATVTTLTDMSVNDDVDTPLKYYV